MVARKSGGRWIGKAWFPRMKKPKAFVYEDICRLVDMVFQLQRTGMVDRDQIVHTIYAALNKGRVGRKYPKKTKAQRELESNYVAGSPKAKEFNALEEARRIFGIRAMVEDDWGTCKVGEKIMGKFVVHGEGPTWQEAFEDAKRKGKA